ncbi:MAG: peptide chain release factor 1 [Bordetella sp.]|nr:MAG: peptide chain release factor 1 [Bordetella sp.]
MKLSIRNRLKKISLRLIEIDQILSDPKATFDMNRFLNFSRERSELEPINNAFIDFIKAENNIESLQSLLFDSEMKSLAEEEIKLTKEYMQKVQKQLQLLLLPVDPNNGRAIFLEIRAGTGGSESSLFSTDLLRMYIRYAEKQNWNMELISESYSELGGYKEVIARISGNEAYNRLKFESGVHRVQRVPITEAQGRIHTSTCTVAVMVEADTLDEIKIKPGDLRIDTFRASGAGGQHVNKTDSAVRITHLPTGIVVACQDDRSQHRNREKAIQVLAARIKDKEIIERNSKKAAERKFLIGSGDRSERVRTYNYSQGRVTDHRINLTLYKIQQIMEGNLDELIDSLLDEYQIKRLEDFEYNEI